MNILKENVENTVVIDANRIGLPTKGAVIEQIEFVTDAQTHGRTGRFYRVSGSIHPVDENAPDIKFQAGFPEEWNGKILQYGGGGLNGFVFPVEIPCAGSGFMAPTPLSKGYAVFLSDSGHQAAPEESWDATWAINDESLENFAHAALKKTKDVVYELAKIFYGKEPEKVYFAGGSNGGRECMKAVQMYPKDYDGAICCYPVLYWVSKVLMDFRNGNALEECGQDGWMNETVYNKVMDCIMEHSDELDGARDGIISNLQMAKEKRAEIEEDLKKIINQKQLEMMKKFAEPLSLPFPLGYGEATLPGYAVFEGAPLIEKMVNMFGSSSAARDVGSVLGADSIIACQILRNENADLKQFRIEEHEKELVAASKLLDSYGTDLDEFYSNGGKMILLQGMSDPLVSVYGTIQYYEDLTERYGEKINEFLKFYVVPGYGHGFGGMFWMAADLLEALDTWVCDGIAPETLMAEDQNDSVNYRTRPLFEYPYFPAYSGNGDINDGKNFCPTI